MPIFGKIARVYLYVLSSFYFVIGMIALVLVMAEFFQFNVPEFFLFPGIIATVFGLAPVRLIFGTTTGGPMNLPNPSFVILIILGLCAVTLSCLGIYALYRISHQQRWIRVWYFIFGIASLMMIDNLFYTATTHARGPSIFSIGIGSAVHFILLFLGIWAIKKEQENSKVIPSPNY